MSRLAVVVGAGPAGLTAAIGLRRAGVPVQVYDPSYPKVQKACGEGFMPTGIAVLAALGIDAFAIPGQTLDDIAYHDGSQCASGRFPCPVRGIARPALMASLMQRAQQMGIDVQRQRVLRVVPAATHVAVHLGRSGDAAVVHADVLIGADGLHSSVRAQLLPKRVAPPATRFGLRQHFRLPSPGRRIHVWFGRDCDAGYIPVGPDLVNVSFLLREPKIGFTKALREFPALQQMLEGATPVDGVRGAGSFWQPVGTVASERVALVGDAAGYVDAITGEGVSMALHTALLLARTIGDGRPLSVYARQHRRVYRHYARQARFVLFVSRIGWLRRAALWLFARRPRWLEFWLRQATLGTRALWPK